MGEPVTLYVYDLSNGLAQSLGPMLVGRPVEGIWHTSVVLYGIEVWFGQGIHAKSPPGTTHHGRPRKQIPLGSTQLPKETVLEYLEGMRETYRAERYHLLEFNCNHFSNDVVGFLNGSSVPSDILNQPKELMATPFGQQMRPMIEQMFVGANNRSAGDAVNNLLPTLGGAEANVTAPDSSASASRDDVPSMGSVTSNLRIVTSASSLRTTLSSSPATAVMFTSSSCPPCNAIKPYFEELARQNLSTAKERVDFALVETGLGAGSEIARLAEFGGPVSATPTFVFFVRGEKVGECKGADRRELGTQVQMLQMAAYPPHPHKKLSLPSLIKLSHNLSPITSTTFPPLATLSAKLASSTSTLDPSVSSVLTKDVVHYLSKLPSPPTKPSDALPPAFVESWTRATLKALEVLSDPATKFPVLDLVRLALARDHVRLAQEPAFLAFVPALLDRLVLDLDHDSPSQPYLLTCIRTFSNFLASPRLTSRLFAPDAVPNLTKLVVRSLLDPQEKMRSAGAGLGWSVVARVYEERVSEAAPSREGSDGLGEVWEDWEVEVAGAVLEALGREDKSVEVVHRLAATLGLLLYRSPYSTEIEPLVQALDASTILEQKVEIVRRLKEDSKDSDGVVGVLRDVQKLVQ
ncbi:hypothetical protein JCM10212_003700 [Sporobolomyces blumeae]